MIQRMGTDDFMADVFMVFLQVAATVWTGS